MCVVYVFVGVGIHLSSVHLESRRYLASSVFLNDSPHYFGGAGLLLKLKLSKLASLGIRLVSGILLSLLT